jgi:ABC-type Zn uptake system ZnuABC Zn-binding protein ZnuA/ABC-type Mn2+/Zn2+ transport system permease subunit
LIESRVVFEYLDLPFVQRGLLEVGVLSIGAGLIGTWIVLRGLAFYSHAVGTAAFPGLVLADGLGFAGPLGALAAAAAFAFALTGLSRSDSDDRGGEVALVLVGMLALGVILASDVFHSTNGVETLLFGSLLLIDPSDVVLAAITSAVALLASLTIGRRWLASGFDGGPADRRGRVLDFTLLAIVALATAAALTAIGALLVAALFVVPAACARPWFRRLRDWQFATVALTAAIGCAGVLLSVEFNAPPGATIAVLGGIVFTLSGLAAWLRARRALGPVLAAVALPLVVFGLSACGPDASASDATVTAVATTPVVADLVRQAGGPGADVEQILAANSDPHEYEPRPDDVAALAGADVVFASGGELDSWVSEAMKQSGSDARLVTLSDSLRDPLPSSEDGSEGIDPHWWHDPRNVERAMPVIAEALAVADPQHGRAFARNARAYESRVAALDRSLARCYGAVPHDERKIVTDHDAFGYLARRYGIEIVGAVIPALTTEAQPSAGELSDLRQVIERENVKAVFPESSVNDDLANAIAQQTGADADQELYGDTLGAPGSTGATYLDAERANADAIVDGITGGTTGCGR